MAETLGKQQLELGFSELCAACHLAAAQLEQAVSASSSNPTLRNGEYNLFLESARSYSETRNVIPISSCYESAISSTSDKALAWMTSMEAGQAALLSKDYTTSVSFFTKAFQLAVDTTEKNLSGNHWKKIFLTTTTTFLCFIKDINWLHLLSGKACWLML